MQTIKVGDLGISRLVLGGNPFSGFSHQSRERDQEMVRYYTAANIKDALRKAEAAGINTLFARTDRHIRRLLLEYWDEGGTIQWVGQTASELGDQCRAVREAVASGAKAVYIHGGIVDFWFAQGQFAMLREAVETIRDCGVPAGLAAHNMDAHRWIRDNLELDFQMCCYYEPNARSANPHHVAGQVEKWDLHRRAEMADFIPTLLWPAIHYKIFAGGNRPVMEGFRFMAAHLRPIDAVCIGHFLKDNPNMIAENVKTFEELTSDRTRFC